MWNGEVVENGITMQRPGFIPCRLLYERGDIMSARRTFPIDGVILPVSKSQTRICPRCGTKEMGT
jgi:hypothetical protein